MGQHKTNPDLQPGSFYEGSSIYITAFPDFLYCIFIAYFQLLIVGRMLRS